MEGDNPTHGHDSDLMEAGHDAAEEPMPTTTGSSAQLLQIFPEEVWRKLLKHVDNDKDFNSVCSASPLFERLLSEIRTQALFPAVLEILMQPRNHQNKYFSRASFEFQELAFLRLVCRAWRKGVNSLFYQIPSDGFWLRILCPTGGSFATYFRSVDDFTAFHNHFSSTHLTCGANPLPARRIVLCLPQGEGALLVPFLDASVSLLQKYGRHVWYFKLAGSSVPASEYLALYSRLKDMFQLLPNLRTLRLELFKLRLLPEGVLESIKESFQESPFPTPAGLAHLHEDGMLTPLFVELIKQELVHLKDLRMTLSDDEDFHTFFENPLTIRVAKLHLNMKQLRAVSWAEIFSGVRRVFGESLEDLWLISLPNPLMLKYEDHVELPKLRKLTIQLDYPVALDFLLGMAAHLEKLLVVVEYGTIPLFERVAAQQERELKIFRHVRQLRESNVWTMFPKLEKMEVTSMDIALVGEKRWKCTRNEWKQLN